MAGFWGLCVNFTIRAFYWSHNLKFEDAWLQITWILTSWRSEAVEAVYRIRKLNLWTSHKSPLLRIPKMNGFCLECNFVRKKCWFEVWQIVFKHPVYGPSLNFKNWLQCKALRYLPPFTIPGGLPCRQDSWGVLIRHNIDSPDGTYMVGRNRQTSKPTFKPWIAGCIDI